MNTSNDCKTIYILIISGLLLLTSCSKSAETICNETSEIIREYSGMPMTDVALSQCYKLSAEEAAFDQDATRKMYESRK